MVTEIGQFSIDDGSPYRHKPKDGWTKVFDVEEVEAVVDEANKHADNAITSKTISANSISVIDGNGNLADLNFDAKSGPKSTVTWSELFPTPPTPPVVGTTSNKANVWADVVGKFTTPFAMDALLKPPPSPAGHPLQDPPYAEEAQYLQTKMPSSNGITFTAQELHSPLGTYVTLYNQHGNLSQTDYNHLMAEFVYLYTDFFFRQGGKQHNVNKAMNSPEVRMDFFSGVVGHGQCGATSPSSAWGLSGVKEVPHTVRCDLPNGHSDYHSAYVKQIKKWLSFGSGPDHKIKKCGAPGVVVRAGESVSVTCGLDEGHSVTHMTSVLAGEHGWRFEKFKETQKPQQKESTVDPMKMVLPKAMSLMIPTNSGPVAVGSVMLEIVNKQQEQKYDDGVALHTWNVPSETTVTITNAEGPVKTWAETFLHAKDPWNDVQWSESNAPITMKHEIVDAPEKKPEPEEQPKVDKYDFSPTVTTFEKQKKMDQKQELRNQAKGIIANADRMPLGAFLFAQKVLAHFGDS